MDGTNKHKNKGDKKTKVKRQFSYEGEEASILLRNKNQIFLVSVWGASIRLTPQQHQRR
jgi:hypothetical protein